MMTGAPKVLIGCEKSGIVRRAMLDRGSIGHAGGFVNLATGQMVPIALPRPK